MRDFVINISFLQCAVDEMGRTQGDRLLAMKAKAQHHLVAEYSSPTTLVKPISGQSKASSVHSPQLLRCGVHSSVPVRSPFVALFLLKRGI